MKDFEYTARICDTCTWWRNPDEKRVRGACHQSAELPTTIFDFTCANWTNDMPSSPKTMLPPVASLTIEDYSATATDAPDPYTATINGAPADVYDVLVAFNVSNPAAAHAVKKGLLAGLRTGGKSAAIDYTEAASAMLRAAHLAQNGE